MGPQSRHKRLLRSVAYSAAKLRTIFRQYPGTIFNNKGTKCRAFIVQVLLATTVSLLADASATLVHLS
jgi:hypothetical protein